MLLLMAVSFIRQFIGEKKKGKKKKKKELLFLE